MTARVLKAPEVARTAGVPPEGVRAALAEAFSQGRELGRQEATAALEREVEALRRELARRADAIRAELAAGARLDAELLTSLATDLSAWFLDATVAVDASAVVESMRGALVALANETGLVLHAHPRVADQLGDPAHLGLDAVRPDSTLGPADFRLASDTAIIERCWRDAIAGIEPEVIAALGPPADG